ncbi:MAG: hypothetical protein NT023_16405 [Armatimonadetes bacterium]|nr:hypothetical protein [Armatimonadota bacterium]
MASNPSGKASAGHQTWGWAAFRSFLGIVMGLALFSLVYPSYLSPQAREARSKGLDPVSYAEVLAIQKRSQEAKPLDDKDVTKLINLLTGDSAMIIKVRALTALSSLTSKHIMAKDAITSAKVATKDPNEAVRLYALSVLYKLCDPQIKEVATQMRQDTSSKVKDMTKQILQKIETDGPPCDK